MLSYFSPLYFFSLKMPFVTCVADFITQELVGKQWFKQGYCRFISNSGLESATSSALELVGMARACNPGMVRRKQDDQKLEALLVEVESSRPARAVY